MRTLVIDAATAACSVALVEGARVIDARHEVVGRGHAERLVPLIAELAEGGRAGRILVDCGPGSFTGVRVGLAAAIGLGIGWGVGVVGYSATALVAAGAPAARPELDRLVVVMEGGHGEVFVQAYDRALAAGPLASLTPAVATAMLDGRVAVGSGVRYLDGGGIDALPVAAEAVLLPDALASLPPRPIYGRAPDARVPA